MNIFKVVIALIAIIYVVSPIDLVPGCPIDDVIIALFAVIAEKKLAVC